eukprot:Gb_40188 [translate_table: standard]
MGQSAMQPIRPVQCLKGLEHLHWDPLAHVTNYQCPESEMEEHKAKNEKCKYSLASMSKHENIDIPENLAPENVDLFKEKRKNSVLRLSSYAIDENGKEVEEWNYLSKFYKCYNKVMLDKMALEIQKKKLNSENMMLQATLQQYLNSTTLSNELMKKVTSLLVSLSLSLFNKENVISYLAQMYETEKLCLPVPWIC